MTTTKKCSSCEEVLSIDCFAKSSKGTMGKQSQCKKCQLIYSTERNKRIKNEDIKMYWCKNVLTGHRDYSINITVLELYDIIKDLENCPICGCKFDWWASKTYSNKPSLDRTNNDDFIDDTNIQVICHSCNRTKSNRTMKEFIEYCTMVADKYG